MPHINIPPLDGGVGGGDVVASVFGRTGIITAQYGDYNTDLVPATVNNKYYKPLYSNETTPIGTPLSIPITESSSGWFFCSIDIAIVTDGQNDLSMYSLSICKTSSGAVISSAKEYVTENIFVSYSDFSVSIVSDILRITVSSSGDTGTLNIIAGNVFIF